MRARTVSRDQYGPWSGILFGPIRGPDFGPALDPDIFWPVVPVLIFNYLHVPDQRKKTPGTVRTVRTRNTNHVPNQFRVWANFKSRQKSVQRTGPKIRFRYHVPVRIRTSDMTVHKINYSLLKDFISENRFKTK